MKSRPLISYTQLITKFVVATPLTSSSVPTDYRINSKGRQWLLTGAIADIPGTLFPAAHEGNGGMTAGDMAGSGRLVYQRSKVFTDFLSAPQVAGPLSRVQ